MTKQTLVEVCLTIESALFWLVALPLTAVVVFVLDLTSGNQEGGER